MGTVHDLEDLRPVIGKITGAPENPEVNEGSETPTASRRRPSESDRHELDHGTFPRSAVCEVHLNSRRDEGQVLSIRWVLDPAEDRPKPFEPAHGTRMA